MLLMNIAFAANFDPELTWRTLQTPHFEITFHQGEEQLADEISGECESIYDTLSAEIQWQPHGRTQVVLVDQTDAANGYAFTAPYNGIVLYVTAPQEDSVLGFYEDWSPAILTHELTHILHLDTNHGLIRATRALIGHIASSNQLSPRWIVEGYATFEETRQTHAGRGRTPLVRSILRTQMLEGDWPALDTLDGFQPDPPAGNLRYLFGRDFMQYIADHAGSAVWTSWAHRYGSHIPYLLPTRRVTGRTLRDWYRDWTAERRAEFEQEAETLRAIGLREGLRISVPGDTSCNGPSVSPDGTKIVWSCTDRRAGPALWVADGDGSNPRVLLQDFGAKNFSWRRDSQALVFASTHVVNRFNSWSDIYLLPDLTAKQTIALTAGKRSRDPEFSPDGTRLWMVTNAAQDNQLTQLTVDRVLAPLTQRTDHAQFSTPRFSPDGRVIAVSVWEDGRRDLWLYSPLGEPLRRLTADPAIDRDPMWSSDGATLYFSSDRSGVPQIYAVDVATERIWQVTNVLTAATNPAPTPDGTHLAYQQLGHNGTEIRLLPVDRSSWLDRGLLPFPIEGAPRTGDLVSANRVAHHAVDWASIGGVPSTPRSRPLSAPPRVACADPTETGPFAACVGRGARSQADVDQYAQTDIGHVFGDENTDYPFRLRPRRYNPLKTLTPRFWLPVIQTTPFPTQVFDQKLPFGVSVSAVTAGTDILAYASWRAGLSYRTDANFLGGGASLVINRWLPVFGVSANVGATPIGTIPRLTPGPPTPDGKPASISTADIYWERRTTYSASVSWPVTWRSAVFGRYQLMRRENLRSIPDDADRTRLPIRGTLGSIAGGWSYAWSRPTAYAISTEDGRTISVVGALFHPWLGSVVQTGEDAPSGFTRAQVTAEAREYWVPPWADNHVIAVRAATGITVGSTQFLGNYQLGGSYGDSGIATTPDEFRLLRGYPVAAKLGDAYWLGSAEYRLPLWQIQRGISALPVFFRSLSAAAFCDAGNAFSGLSDPAGALDAPLLGAGVELRASAIVGWGVAVQGRLGWATGLGSQGIAWNDPRAFYFQLGTSY
jgi:Tol biopolymer transport system component